MKTIRIPTCIASFVISIALLLQSSPALAGGSPNVELTYTKWVTIVPGYPVMEGVVGGDIVGTFAGTVLKLKPIGNGQITYVEALYVVIAGPHTFTVDFQGNENDTKGFVGAPNTLNGTIVDGWLTGAQVHVHYVSFLCAQPNALDGLCYTGTIRILAGSGH
jgi:hypothetical protein